MHNILAVCARWCPRARSSQILKFTQPDAGFLRTHESWVFRNFLIFLSEYIGFFQFESYVPSVDTIKSLRKNGRSRCYVSFPSRFFKIRNNIFVFFSPTTIEVNEPKVDDVSPKDDTKETNET